MEDARILEILKASTDDSSWVSKEFDVLRSRYEGKVLAVKGKKVVGYADTVEELLGKLDEAREDLLSVLIETVPPKMCPSSFRGRVCPEYDVPSGLL